MVVIAVALPLLLTAMWYAARHSARVTVAWAGAVAYLTYQAVRFSCSPPR